MALEKSGRKQAAPFVAEFLGTYVLVFSIGSNVIGKNTTWGVFSIAATLMVLVYSFAEVSGANFNPAVSLALGATGNLSWSKVLGYSLAQIFGGMLGAHSYMLLWGKHIYFAPSYHLGYSWLDAGLVEMLYTFMLCFVVLNVACVLKPKGGQFYGLAIGFVIVAGGYGAGTVSGGCFNPAVAIAIDSAYYYGAGWVLVYIGFQIAGAALAAALYHVVRPEMFGSATRLKIIGVPVPALICELLGTMMLVATVGFNILGESPAPGLSIGAALMCMIYAVGDVSGAHFNPAVTLAILASGRHVCSVKRAVLYVIVQIIGAILGVLLPMSMHNWRALSVGPTWDDVDWTSVVAVEVIFTFLLCYTVLCVATVQNSLSQYFGLVIGFCILLGAYAVGEFSGGTMNPAATIAIWLTGLLAGTGASSGFHMVGFLVLEALAAVTASGVFSITHSKEYEGFA